MSASTEKDSKQAGVGYLALVRANPNFRNLWFGQIVSLLGDWFNLIASAALVAQLSGSGLAVGALFAVRMLAIFVISPFAGVWADRFNRRRLLLITDFLRAFTVIGFLFVRDPEDVWLLYALTAIQLGISGVFFPTRNAILPNLVNRSELGAANALTSATWSVMLAVGAALGGVVAGAWGIYPAFVIDALTFLLSAVFIYKIRYEQPPGEEVAKGVLASLNQYADGLRYLRKRNDILIIALLKAAASLTITGGFEVLQVVIANEYFPIGEGGSISLGIMYMTVGVGTGLGPILARRFTGDDQRKLRLAIILGYGISAVGLALAATLQNFGVVIAGTLLRGIGSGINWVFSTQLLLMLVPDRIRGRIFSTEFAVLTLMAAGALTGYGWLLDNSALGVSGILVVMTVSVLIPGVLWGLWVFFGNHEQVQVEAVAEAAD